MRTSMVLPFACVAMLVHACGNDHLGPEDTGLLLIAPSPIPNSELAVSTVDASGRLSPGAYVIAKSGAGFGSPVLTQFQDHAVAAWIEGGTGNTDTVDTLYLGMLSLK